MKKICFLLILFIGIIIVSNKLLGSTMAYSYEMDKSVLFYKENIEELESDIKVYLDYIDDYLIVNSSYLYSDKLAYNYDFLVHFALDYILGNKEYYIDNIRQSDECTYMTKEGIFGITRDYVEIDMIYEITNFYFGINDFLIINDDVCLMDGYVSLSDYTGDVFELEINDVLVDANGNDIDAFVTYDNDIKYLYSFYNDNNILKLVNVEVVS